MMRQYQPPTLSRFVREREIDKACDAAFILGAEYGEGSRLFERTRMGPPYHWNTRTTLNRGRLLTVKETKQIAESLFRITSLPWLYGRDCGWYEADEARKLRAAFLDGFKTTRIRIVLPVRREERRSNRHFRPRCLR